MYGLINATVDTRNGTKYTGIYGRDPSFFPLCTVLARRLSRNEPCLPVNFTFCTDKGTVVVPVIAFSDTWSTVVATVWLMYEYNYARTLELMRPALHSTVRCACAAYACDASASILYSTVPSHAS